MAALLGAVFALPTFAQQEEDADTRALKGRTWYVSPTASYILADEDRGTDDGYGGTLAIGKKVTRSLTLELMASYSQMDPDPAAGLLDNGTFTLSGVGVGLMLFPSRSIPNLYGRANVMHGQGEDHPGLIANYDTTLLDVGLGYLFEITPKIIIRAEALYRQDPHNRALAGIQPKDNSDFYDGVYNLGLVIPLGHTPPPDPETIDTDGDGVPDYRDQCPDSAPGSQVNETGCELDTDGDGVPDGQDQCPDTPAGAQVNSSGCPIDSDGDGLPDDIDECPNSPAGAKVLENGCALAGDCRRPRPGEEVDANGCAANYSFILKGVKFEFDSDRLTADAKEILNKVAETLIAYPEIDVEVEGHTDYLGTDAYNLGLSERRAIAVKEYLAGRGVAPERMIPVGYGKARPIMDNTTEEGREENRRVELRPAEM
ncbi:OmpA family protein [Flagellatimonas centrodinii]|uniref:OmpA family protein n=1 Tax=Flagellatimonas centrodinii TaxID=2806210 RepID=UPI001FFA7677|nr:OmpA family protein [Flagellatimonas centrodinii]ULQ45627.1 OmpA family protein [Flagellatimonas centrodinii]